MEVVGKLAGGIAHDFNNLLTAINGYSDLALRKVQKKSDAYNDIKVIKDCGERAARLTKQLLGFSRKQIAEKTKIDLNQTISELKKMLKRLIGEEITLKTSFQKKSCMILADKSQLEQVLVNLVVNARDAIEGYGKIIISTQEETLDSDFYKKHNLNEEKKYIKISVIDDGQGMSNEVKQKIFEPFFTTKEVNKGTGLGLSTVFGIVKQNEGTIIVNSEVGKGSEFSIFLPKLKTEEFEIEEEVHETETEQLPTGDETILLVDDEESIRGFLSEILVEQGYKIIEAENGVDGLKKFENINDELSLLITDITMPNMSGPELAEKIREKKSDLKALFISGNVDNEFYKNNKANANVSFLHKPFTYETIITKVREILDK